MVHVKNKALWNKLKDHTNHDITIVSYGNKTTGIVNISIECNDCSEVLIDLDNPE